MKSAVIKSFCVLGLSLGIVLSAQADGLLEVKQTIFGMDCAPCAYGVQQRLKKLPGITQVEVSLNDGVASIDVAPDSPVTLAQIHDVLVDGGFTPKQAVVTVEGRITKDGEHLLLVSGASRYTLSFPAGVSAAAAQPDARVKVTGTVDDPAGSPVPVLAVQSAEAAAGH
jgi:copper chaperone CopZ